MSLPITGPALLPLCVLFGLLFGWLLHRARVSDSNVIINQFRLRDFTVLKVMLTAIVVGGIGVWLAQSAGAAVFHIKPAYLLGVALGAALFGIGMVVLGYCPGTALVAIGTGSLHAMVGTVGMLLGAILFALSFDWMKAHVMSVASYGPVRLPDITGVPGILWLGGLLVVSVAVFMALERRRG